VKSKQQIPWKNIAIDHTIVVVCYLIFSAYSHHADIEGVVIESSDSCNGRNTLLLLQQGDTAVWKRDYDQRLDNLTAQLVESEEVLGNKENQIQALQQRIRDTDALKKQLAQQKEEIEALHAQVAALMLSLLHLCD